MAEFCMPALGADMEAGVLVAWRSKPGDRLQRGDVIAEVETDKGVIEVEVWSSGVLERYLVQPGAKVPVGTPLAILSDAPAAPSSAAQRPLDNPPIATTLPAPQLGAAASTGRMEPQLLSPAQNDPQLAASMSPAQSEPQLTAATPAHSDSLLTAATLAQSESQLTAAKKTPLAASTTPLAASTTPLAASTTPIPASPAVRRRARELGIDLRELAARSERLTMADLVAARPEPSATAHVPSATAHVRSSPAARKRAQELGIALESLRGTGPEGVIVLADVERAKAAPPPAADRSGLRRAIAAAMSRSKREIPHYYLTTTIDCTRALAWLSSYNAAHSVKERMLPGALLIKAVARACRARPELNCVWDGENARNMPDVNVGVAVALRGGGLIAPAIRQTDTLPLPQLMDKLQDLVLRARAGTLRSSELSDGTITVTSLGERGVESVLPIIYPPQTAIVGFGRIADRPWVVDGALTVRALVSASLAADHRVTDGRVGAGFLTVIDELLQEPEHL